MCSRHWTLILLSLFLAAPAVAQDVKVDIPFEKFTLKNGLTVIVHEDRKAPIVAVNLWYHVGSKNERRGRTGFAHLFEHLMFNGSEHFNQDYFKVLEKLGATNLNGTTNQDRTNYFQNVPTPALDTVLWMESDRMGHMVAVVDQARLDEQRGVVQNEKRQGENQPYGLVYDRLVGNTYPSHHPYSWTVIGSMDDLSAATLKDTHEWFKTYYGPNNATIVLAGDIDAKTAREKVERYFGAIPPSPPIAKQVSWVSKMEGTHRDMMQDRVPQARTHYIWNVPEAFTLEADLLWAACNVLGGGKTSRLYKRLVYDDQIATDVGAFLSAAELGSQVVIQATARPGGDLGKVEAAIEDELKKFLANGPTEEELALVKTRYVAGFLRGIERIGGFGGKSDVLARGQVFRGNPAAYKTEVANRMQATTAAVKATSVKWLSDGVYILQVHPFAKPEAISTNVDRSKVPEPGPPPALKLPKFERATLSNGLKVMLAQRHEIPIVNINLMVSGGYAADQLGIPGTARLTMAMLDEGTRTRKSLEIADAMERLGGQLGTSANLDFCNVFLSSLKQNLDASLAIWADVILNPTFPDGDFGREQKLALAAIERERVDPFGMALRVLPPLLYGKGHAYGIPMSGSGTEGTVKTINRDALAKFHSTWFKPNNATLVIAGDTTLAEITPKIEKLFANWKGGDVPKLNIATVQHPEKPSVYLIDRPGAVQSVILAGQVAPPKSDRDDLAMETLNTLFGGAFISRLNMNLREGKHWSYGAGTAIFDSHGQRPFFAFAPVQTDKTKESLAEVNKEFREILRQRPASPEELKMAQDNQTLRLPGSRETTNSVLGSMQDVVRHSLPDDYFETYTGKVRALTTSDMQRAAERLFRPDGMIWVVVGDRSKIEAGVRELALGDLKFVDADGNPLN
jgi:zinc protease